ncbi:MAG TPA: hypothetical protein VNV66_15470 [Pilimelia sp.]|nr:hypothetical protein [Pilimelia sp.]
MRRISRAIAGLALAGAATFGGLSVAGPASAHSGGPLVDVTVEDVLNGNEVYILNDVTVGAAAAVCGVDVDVLTSILNDADRAECKALTTIGKKGWVKK